MTAFRMSEMWCRHHPTPHLVWVIAQRVVHQSPERHDGVDRGYSDHVSLKEKQENRSVNGVGETRHRGKRQDG